MASVLFAASSPDDATRHVAERDLQQVRSSTLIGDHKAFTVHDAFLNPELSLHGSDPARTHLR